MRKLVLKLKIHLMVLPKNAFCAQAVRMGEEIYAFGHHWGYGSLHTEMFIKKESSL